VLALVCAFTVPIALARPAAASTGPTLGPPAPASGGPGTSVTYLYSWDTTECGVSLHSLEIELFWDSPYAEIGSTTARAASCTGSVTGVVPSDTSRGNTHLPTASLFDNNTGTLVGNSEATATTAFTVPPASTPTPTPRRTPTPRSTPTPIHKPPPSPTPVTSAAPRQLPTPTPFVIGGGGGGSGGGAPEGGADCSGGIGRSPTPGELASDSAALAAPGEDPTFMQMRLLSSDEYFSDAGNNPVGFITRLYDDVLRHDPTPIEITTALQVMAGGTDTSRARLVEDVVLSPEARAIRVDQAFHALLKIYPNAADLALWVNRLSGPGAPGISSNVMVGEIAGSATYYALVGGTAADFMNQLFEDLLNRPPTADELTAYAGAMKEIQGGEAAARVAVAEDVVSGAEFRADEVTSFFANYMHATCKELVAEECTSTLGTPTTTELSASLTSLSTGTSEEDIIAGIVGSDQFYADQGSTQTGLIKGVYQELVGRPPTSAEIATALSTYTNDSIGHTAFAQAMVQSLPYQDLVVSLDYQELLLRAPTPLELDAGQGVLTGDAKSLQTPDDLLIESIVSTPEFYADAGGTVSAFAGRSISTLLGRPATSAQELAFVHLSALHDLIWRAAVARSIVNGTEYRADFVRGAYAKYLTFSACAVTAAQVAGDAGDPGFFNKVPGGWFGLGVCVGVLLMGAAGAVFFTLERRRFSRLYPNEVPRHHPE
jgi:hypothetical protein